MALNFNQRSFTKTVDQAAIDEGLRAYMLKVYNYMTTGLVLTGFIAYFFGKASVEAYVPGGVILTPIGNTSFIEIYIKNIMRLGFNEVIFIIHHGKKEIISYLEKSNNTDNLKYSFLYDGKIQAGTAGALINNVEKLPENFWLTYGDTLLNFDPLIGLFHINKYVQHLLILRQM